MLFAAANTPDAPFVHLTWIRQLPLLLTHLTAMLDKDKSVEEFYRGLACIKALLIVMNRHYRAYARASQASAFPARRRALTRRVSACVCARAGWTGGAGGMRPVPSVVDPTDLSDRTISEQRLWNSVWPLLVERFTQRRGRVRGRAAEALICVHETSHTAAE